MNAYIEPYNTFVNVLALPWGKIKTKKNVNKTKIAMIRDNRPNYYLSITLKNDNKIINK